jgi:predicted dehydrogenase
VDYITAGAIGDVTQVHVWTNRPIWPQGIPRPGPFTLDRSRRLSQDTILRAAMGAVAGNGPPPSTLSWDLFLGVAPVVEYDPIYHPFNWRGWVDWGQGALGDMGVHLVDHPVWALELGLPTTIETIATPFNGASYPHATTTYYEFAARAGKPAVKMTWYDGGLTPPKPEELGDERVDPAGGILYIGSRGKMVQETYGQRPRLLPAERHNSYGPPKEVLPRVAHQSHEMNWVNAIRGTDKVTCPFSYAAHLNEIMLLGVASLRARSKLYYDGKQMRVTNNPAANEFLTRTYRQGYSL